MCYLGGSHFVVDFLLLSVFLARLSVTDIAYGRQQITGYGALAESHRQGKPKYSNKDLPAFLTTNPKLSSIL